MAEVNGGAVIDRMHQVLGVRTDIALGHHFGLGTSTVSGWRTRNRVPYEECMILAKRNGVSLDWLLRGIGAMDATLPPSGLPDDDADPRLQRIGQFFAHWHATRNENDQVWLEMQLSRAVPEYAEWLASRSGRD